MKHRALALATALSILTGDAVRAESIARLGGELRVNTYTVDKQRSPSVALDAEGDFVVVWQSYLEDSSDYGVFGRRFTSSGTALGASFQVPVRTAGIQALPEVASETNGDFVVAWIGSDGGVYGIFARRFNSSGTASGGELQLNTYTTNAQQYPAIAMDGDGDFVVVWESNGQDGNQPGIFGRRINSSGTIMGAEFAVNVYTSGSQVFGSVAMDGAGNLAVSWASIGQDQSSVGVFARLFTSTGVGGDEFQVHTYTTGEQSHPSVVRDADGDFVIAWSSDQEGTTDIRARRFNALGAAQATEFQVNAYTFDAQARPAAAMRDDGSFVIAWQSRGEEGPNYALVARAFASDGTSTGGEFRVNSFSAGDQRFAAIDQTAGGRFVVAWESAGSDGAAYGIAAQRFATLAILDVDGNGEVTALTDALLVLRYVFGFTGSTLTAGAVGSDCTRCDAAAIEPYLAGLT